MLTEWQVYRMFESRRGAWATFQFLVRERLLDDGCDRRALTVRRLVGPDYATAASAASRLEARVALLRRPHGRQRVVLDVVDVGRNRSRLTTLPPATVSSVPCAHLALAEPERAVPLDDLEAPSVEAKKTPRGPRRARAGGRRRARGRADPARARRSTPRPSRRVAVRGACASLPECAAIAKIASESTVISRLGARAGRGGRAARRRSG